MKLTKDIVKFNKIELENKVHLNPCESFEGIRKE